MHRDARRHAVQRDVVAGQPHQVALHFEADDAALRHARREAQHRRAAAAADVEHQLPRFGRHRGGEKDRIDRDAGAVRAAAGAGRARRAAVLGETARRRRSSLSAAPPRPRR